MKQKSYKEQVGELGSLSQKFLRKNVRGRSIDGEIGLLRGEYALLRLVADGDPAKGIGEKPSVRVQAIDITPAQKPQLPKVTEITIEYGLGRKGQRRISAEVERIQGERKRILNAREALPVVVQAVNVLRGYGLR